MPSFLFEVEYAKSNRAACKGCKGKIDQGALKVGWRVPPSEDPEKRSHAAEAPKFHHVACLPKAKGAKWFKTHLPEDVENVGGVANLTESDRERLVSLFAACRGEGAVPEAAEAPLESPAKGSPAAGRKRKAAEAGVGAAPEEEDNETKEKRAKVEAAKANLLKKSVAQLQAMLARNGLPKTGRKEELQDRVAESSALGVPPVCPTCDKVKLRWTEAKKTFSCPGFFSDEEKRFVRCKGPEAGASLERTPWQELF